MPLHTHLPSCVARGSVHGAEGNAQLGCQVAGLAKVLQEKGQKIAVVREGQKRQK